MAAVASKNTKPEMIIRSMLHRLGFRFRLHNKKLPGKPDIVLPKLRTVIFVHGCFWHRHNSKCKKTTMPQSNQIFWIEKFNGNIERDNRNVSLLKKSGWKVLVVWECELKNMEKLQKSLIKKLLKDLEG